MTFSQCNSHKFEFAYNKLVNQYDFSIFKICPILGIRGQSHARYVDIHVLHNCTIQMLSSAAGLARVNDKFLSSRAASLPCENTRLNLESLPSESTFLGQFFHIIPYYTKRYSYSALALPLD